MMLKCCWNVFWTDHLQMMIEMMPLFRKRTRTWKGTRKGVDETHLSYIWLQKLFQRLIWINYQNCKKKNLFTYDIRNVELQQNPPIFTNICTFGFGFGIRPKARYFSGQIFGFGLKWKTYICSFTDSAKTYTTIR